MHVDQELREAMAAHDPIREGSAFFSHLAQTLRVAEIQLDDCLVEGVGFLPRHVPHLEGIVKAELRACFVGRSTATSKEVFGHETEHRIYDGWSDDQQRQLTDGLVRWTGLIRRDCAEHDVPFVDLAGDFEAGLSQAQAVLLGS